MPKTTIKVRTKRWDVFNRECKAASLRRDDFLDRALPGEIALLQSIPACDEEGERWLKKTWVEHGAMRDSQLHPVPILLSKNVIEQLNSACAEKRVPRDAFLDCVLTFFIERLYEAVIVIKNPRTTRDLMWQISDVLTDTREELTDRDRDGFIKEAVDEWCDARYLVPFCHDFYRDRLFFDAERVANEKSMLESLDIFRDDDPAPKIARLTHNDSDAGSQS